ncbi:MAG: class I SAM-dependent methyltransferase, partial [Spirochaetia bacterium]|nr:class I SAM-dependent methyltransferase [Spirochaetia bacterium]
GVLHYNDVRAIDSMLKEVRRILKSGGHFLGTLRAVGDSHLETNADLPDVQVRFFSESEARSLIAAVFENVELGYAERSPVGQLDRRVCHWIFRAIKV